MNAIEITNLHKSFGTHKVLDGLCLSVPMGSIFGFIGQNGAGKTTTMKTILGLMKTDSGSIKVCGEKVCYGETPTNRMIGYLPDVPSFYDYMIPREYLSLCGEITGLDKNKIKAKSMELLEMVGLKNNNQKIGGFSRGMKQRLGIAQALLGEPKVLICDEPTSALDPAGRKEILDILKSVKGDSTVIFSTHILSDVERICDTVAVLHDGKIVLNGSLSDIKKKYTHEAMTIEFDQKEQVEKLYKLIQTYEFDCEILDSGIMIQAKEIQKVQGIILEILAKEKLLPVKMELMEPTLESLFLEVIQ